MAFKKFLKFLLAGFTLTRVYSVGVYHLLSLNPKLLQQIIEDQFHHYHIGIIVLVISLALKKKINFLTAIGLGIILEEWPIVLSDLGLPTKNLYHTKIDFIVLFIILSLAFFFVSRKSQSKAPKPGLAS